MSLANHYRSLLALAAALAAGPAAHASAPAGPEPCPVSYSHLQIPLRHQGGVSTPTVELSFTNETKKKILKAKFGLILLDSQGVKAPYSQLLTFSTGADPGKVVSGEWALEMEKIDINHIGETVYLKSARFEDGSSWVDDGFEHCRVDINFGPK
jgi:hypothetical protein